MTTIAFLPHLHPGRLSPKSRPIYSGRGFIKAHPVTGKPVQVGAIITTPDEVHDAKLQLDNAMESTNRQWEQAALGNPQNNPQFSQAAANDYFAWDSFWNTWNSFVLEDSSYFSASGDMARVNDYATQLQAWQTRLQADTVTAANPTGTAPILKAQAPTTDPGILGSAVSTQANAVWGIAKPILLVGGLLLGGYVLFEMSPVLFRHHARR